MLTMHANNALASYCSDTVAYSRKPYPYSNVMYLPLYSTKYSVFV